MSIMFKCSFGCGSLYLQLWLGLKNSPITQFWEIRSKTSFDITILKVLLREFQGKLFKINILGACFVCTNMHFYLDQGLTSLFVLMQIKLILNSTTNVLCPNNLFLQSFLKLVQRLRSSSVRKNEVDISSFLFFYAAKPQPLSEFILFVCQNFNCGIT